MKHTAEPNGFEFLWGLFIYWNNSWYFRLDSFVFCSLMQNSEICIFEVIWKLKCFVAGKSLVCFIQMTTTLTTKPWI